MIKHTRREVLAALASIGGAAMLGAPGLALAKQKACATGEIDLAARKHDWDWLIGDWDVFHRRLKERLVGDTRWEEFNGKSVLWLGLDGLATIDDNFLALPDGDYRGLTIRAYDPATDRWSIWWIDGRNPTYIEPPVLGGFKGDVGTFVGHDKLRDQPILMRFRWSDVHGKRPWWEQAFSPDEGKTWEVNWRNYFTRTAAKPSGLPRLPDAPTDWNFLAGSWQVQHRKLKQRFANSDQWLTFDGTLRNWPLLGGHANIGDNVFNLPGGTVRGLGLRNHDAKTGQWTSWWLDGREPTKFGEPLRGGFKDGIALMLGEDTHDGKTIKTRVTWSEITARSAKWEQSGSLDGGKTWEVNWVSEFTRTA